MKCYDDSQINIVDSLATYSMFPMLMLYIVTIFILLMPSILEDMQYVRQSN